MYLMHLHFFLPNSVPWPGGDPSWSAGEPVGELAEGDGPSLQELGLEGG